MKLSFRRSSCFQADELADLRRLVLAGWSREASTRSQPAGTFGYRKLAPSTFLALCSQSFELRLQCDSVGFRSQAVIRRLIPCTRWQLSLPPFADPSASSISATDRFPTFVVCDQSLLDWNSRLRLASEPTLRPVPLRRNCGPQPTVSNFHPL